MSFEAAGSLLQLTRRREMTRFPRANVRVMDPKVAARTVARQIVDIARTGRGTVLTPGCNTPLQMYKQLFLEGGIDLARQLMSKDRNGFRLGMIDGVEMPVHDKLSFPYYFIQSFLGLYSFAPLRSMADPAQRRQAIEAVYGMYNNVFIPHLEREASAAEKVTAVEMFNNWLGQHLPVDLVVCGLGPDGHIAFLGPGTELNWNGPHAERVKLWPGIQAWKWLEESDEACKCALLGSCEVGHRQAPEHAITITLKTLLSAKRIILMAEGYGKGEAVARLVNGRFDPLDFTAHYLATVPEKVEVILDRDAARLL